MEEEKEVYKVVKEKIEKAINEVKDIMRGLGIKEVNIVHNPAHRIIFLGLLTHYINLLFIEERAA